MPRETHQETDPDGLTAKQRIFVEHYFINPDATTAHRKAGYRCKESNRESLASQILSNPRVQAALAKLREGRAKNTGITADKVVRELALIAFANHKDYFEWGTNPSGNWLKLTPSEKLTTEQSAAVKSIKHTVKAGKVDEDTMEIGFHDKIRALQLLGEHLGIFDKRTGSPDEFREWLDRLKSL